MSCCVALGVESVCRVVVCRRCSVVCGKGKEESCLVASQALFVCIGVVHIRSALCGVCVCGCVLSIPGVLSVHVVHFECGIHSHVRRKLAGSFSGVHVQACL